MTHEAGTQKTQDLNFEIQTIKKCIKIVQIVNRKINQRLFNSAGKKSATSSIQPPFYFNLTNSAKNVQISAKRLKKTQAPKTLEPKNLRPQNLRAQKTLIPKKPQTPKNLRPQKTLDPKILEPQTIRPLKTLEPKNIRPQTNLHLRKTQTPKKLRPKNLRP